MAGEVPGARVELIPGAGHLSPLEQPARVAEALGAFFRGILCRPEVRATDQVFASGLCAGSDTLPR